MTPQRILDRTVTDGDCLLWQGAVTENGYGQAYFQGKAMAVHRAAYIANRGPIEGELTVDHLCRRKLCINPEHMELVTRAENVRRWAATITHCPQGHEYGDLNTYLSPSGWRQCRTCRNARNAEWRARKRAA